MLKDSLLTRLSPKYRNILWSIAIILFSASSFFGAQFASVFIALTLLLITGNNKDQAVDMLSNNPTVQLLVSLLVGVITLTIIYKFLKRLNLNPKKILLLENKPNLSKVIDVVLLYGMYFLSLIVVTIVLGVFTNVDVNQSQELGITRPDDIAGKLTIFLMIVVLPPIIEEILFRGFLFNMLKKRTTYIVAAILTSVLFGAAHLEYDNLNWIAAIDTLIFSGFLIYIAQKHQSIYSSMILHGIKNSIAFYVLFVR